VRQAAANLAWGSSTLGSSTDDHRKPNTSRNSPAIRRVSGWKTQAPRHQIGPRSSQRFQIVASKSWMNRRRRRSRIHLRKKICELVCPPSRSSWIICNHILWAIASSGTVSFTLRSWLTTVTSPEASQRLCPVFVSQSCNHKRKVVTRARTTLTPTVSNLSMRVWSN